MMVRMNDEDIRKEYITQMEIILNGATQSALLVLSYFA